MGYPMLGSYVQCATPGSSPLTPSHTMQEMAYTVGLNSEGIIYWHLWEVLVAMSTSKT